jgi:WD40 repeat protein
MSKRSILRESSYTSHKRHATAPQDEVSLPSSAPPSPSLDRASSLSIPLIPLPLIADLILPFVADRAVWTNVCCTSKELCLAVKKMTPPWPNTTLKWDGRNVARQVTFSPSGSQLAFIINRFNSGQYDIRILDRWGKEVLLTGHNRIMHCLEYSSDGEYLASGSQDGLIRLWRTASFHADFSKTSTERSTRTPAQAESCLLFHNSNVSTLAFSRTDSNFLASGGSCGTIKVWNVKERSCVHSFNPGYGNIRCLCFTGGAECACIAVANNGSIIRLWKAEDSSDFASETIGNAAGLEGSIPPVLFGCGASLTTITDSTTESMSTMTLHELETMTKTQFVMPHFTSTCFAVSPNRKILIVGDNMGRIRLLQADDFSVQRDLDSRGKSSEPEWGSNVAVVSVALDPTFQVLACCCDGTVVLRTL